MRSLIVIVVAISLALAPAAIAQRLPGSSPASLCRTAIGMAERALGLPDRLMQAIGIVESGRPDERGGISAWPWTINVEGTGYSFESKPKPSPR